MSWTEDVALRLGEPGAFSQLRGLIEEALSEPVDLESLKDLLGASSMLLHAGALDGQLLSLPLGRVIEAADILGGPDAQTAVIAIGEMGRATLAALAQQRKPGAFPQLFYLDLETSRGRDLAPEVIPVIFESNSETEVTFNPRYGEYLRALYRATAGTNSPLPLLAEHLAKSHESRVTAHVVIGIEDPWVTVLPDLLLDLREFFGRGSRGRTVLHLLTRPFPKAWGSFRGAIQEIENSRAFDQAFMVSANLEVVASRTAEFILLSALVPEILLQRSGSSGSGAFGSYGMAKAPLPAEGNENIAAYLSSLEAAYACASPNWIPGKASLLELAEEQVFLIHPTQSPPPEAAWRLGQEIIPIAVKVACPTLCRMQRGLRVADLRLE